jgi:putative transposase
MSRHVSPSTNRSYGVLQVTRVWGAARATLYRHRRGDEPAAERRPGPVGPMPDEALVEAIRALLAAGPFHGEGYRKVWARLRFTGVRTAKRRVLRLMRQHDLLAPGRVGRPHGPRAHDGTIRTTRVDAMWGSDLTSTLTAEGQASIFVAVDHCSTECVGIHAARRATRFEALEPIRQGVRACFGAFAEGVATGLALRHDHGSQYVADDSRPSSPSSASSRRPPSSVSPRAMAAPSGSSARSRRTSCGSAASPPSRTCARRSTRSKTPTTGPGSSSATATRPQRLSERRSSRRSQWRHELATRCLAIVDRYILERADEALDAAA